MAHRLSMSLTPVTMREVILFYLQLNDRQC
jgi:hypothetical protein